MQAGREQRTVDPGGELLHPRIEGVAAYGQRRGLDDPGAGVGFHQARQRAQALAAHHAVGVEHDHVAVLAAPAAAEVGHVAGLALHAVAAPAVEDATEAAHGAADFHPGVVLGGAQVGVAAVREDKEVEVGQVARALERLIRRPQPGEDACHVLVGNRHDDCRAGGWIDWRVRRGAARDQVAVAALGQHQEAHHRRPEPGRHPREQDREQGQDGHFERIGAMVRQHLGHEVRGHRGLGNHQPQQEPAAMRAGRVPLALGVRAVVQGVPGLGHRRAARHLAPGIAQPAAHHMGRPLARHHRRALRLRAGIHAHGAVVAALQQRLAIHLRIAVGHRQAARHRGVGRTAGRGSDGGLIALALLGVAAGQPGLQLDHRGRHLDALGGHGGHRRHGGVGQQFAAQLGRGRQAVDIALACCRLGRALL
ncbi:hypothetical protein D3C72_783910 [compost metagenome]